jgi:hypothetical protein
MDKYDKKPSEFRLVFLFFLYVLTHPKKKKRQKDTKTKRISRIMSKTYDVLENDSI